MKASAHRTGFALVAFLMILVMTVVLVVAFTVSMRTERAVASNSLSSQRTELYVQSAMANAISLLAGNIPDPADPSIETANTTAVNWFTNPGQLTVVKNVAGVDTTLVVPLHTGATAAADPKLAANLNAPSPTTGKYPITGSNDPMWISWANVVQDPSRPVEKSNKLVGRYAFWIDDESTKINVNTARGKTSDSAAAGMLPPGWAESEDRSMSEFLTPTFALEAGAKTIVYSLSHPATVNLDLLGVDTSELAGSILTNGFLVTPDAIKSFATGDPEDFYEANKFNLTPFSRSPEFNVFGKPRLYMGNRSSDLADGPMFQHFAHPAQPTHFWAGNGGLGSGSTSAVDKDLLWHLRESQAKSLAQALNREWPGFGNKRFRWTKVPEDLNGVEESERIAIGMASVGYWSGLSGFTIPTNLPNAVNRFAGVSGAYSENNTIPVSTGDDTLWKGGITSRPSLPPSVFPQLTELGVQLIPYPSGAVNWKLMVRIKPEFYYPPGFPAATGTFTNGATKGWKRSTQSSSNYLTGMSPAYFKITVNSGSGTRTNLFNLYSVATSVNSSNSPLNGQKPQLPEIGIDEYKPVLMNAFWVSTRGDGLGQDVTYNSSTGLPSNTNSGATFSGSATVTVELRFATYQSGARSYFQVAPIYAPSELPAGWGTPVPPPLGMKAPESEDDAKFKYTFSISAAPDFAAGYTKSFEVTDSRLCSTKHAWAPSDEGSFGEENINNAVTPSMLSKWFPVDFGKSTALRYQSLGAYTSVPVGVRGGAGSHTLQFHEYTPGEDELPDWLTLDLLAPRYAGTGDDNGPISHAQSTAGKINLNSKIYPSDNPYFTPPRRTTPHQALFHHMPKGNEIAANVAAYQDTVGPFDYVGRICEVPGVADSGDLEFNKEMIVRQLASVMTTQSNTFGIWGVAQSIKKRPSNTKYGEFEPGDVVVGEKRFHAVIERYIWPGADGIPGNGKVDEAGIYAKTPGAPGAVLAGMDGPQATVENQALGLTPWEASSLETASNPLAAVMKYKVIYFTYLE